jgi:penicillin amidase
VNSAKLIFPLLSLLYAAAAAERVPLAGLHKPVEILRDRWGVPHIYASGTADLFFAQGYIAARDRLYQIDLWRRGGTGKLAEIMGPDGIERDRLARAVRYRGDPEAEWRSYGPDTKAIATAFTNGINAYIRSLGGKRPLEFRIAGYDPQPWVPEDCLARVAGLLMTRNLTREISRSRNIKRFGLAAVAELQPPDPAVPIEIPHGLNLDDIDPEIIRVYNQVTGVRPDEQGSNNWVIDGTLSATGKPILANDPHRPVRLPSLRKTVHLVAPGWNAIGAGEPALPGIALGHNERVAFGFTIVGIDQQDLYVEKLNPENPDQYMYRGAWKPVEIERQQIAVKGRTAPESIELRYTIHGPVIHEDRARHRAYALRWVGTEPGTAGYLAGLSIARAQNWREFLAAMDHYHVPSENIVYADVDGNIGWQAAGMAPVRPNWSGLLPVPGDSGEYEWKGFRKAADLPRLYNPPQHFIATANHNILPPGFKIPLGYEWALSYRFLRIHEMLTGAPKFSVADFERIQQDVTSIPARRLQAVVKQWHDAPGLAREIVSWDCRMTTGSRAAALAEVWMAKLRAALPDEKPHPALDVKAALEILERRPDPKILAATLQSAAADLEKLLGKDQSNWTWGRLHRIDFRHPLGQAAWNRGPIARPGDSYTVNATSGNDYQQTNGASYRHILDVADWDRSVMTNVPGESGDPESPHYDDLLKDWAAGRYHPMPYSRKAVEAATVERIALVPAEK